jgi:hypothetical protein
LWGSSCGKNLFVTKTLSHELCLIILTLLNLSLLLLTLPTGYSRYSCYSRITLLTLLTNLRYSTYSQTSRYQPTELLNLLCIYVYILYVCVYIYIYYIYIYMYTYTHTHTHIMYITPGTCGTSDSFALSWYFCFPFVYARHSVSASYHQSLRLPTNLRYSTYSRVSYHQLLPHIINYSLILSTSPSRHQRFPRLPFSHAALS